MPAKFGYFLGGQIPEIRALGIGTCQYRNVVVIGKECPVHKRQFSLQYSSKLFNELKPKALKGSKAAMDSTLSAEMCC